MRRRTWVALAAAIAAAVVLLPAAALALAALLVDPNRYAPRIAALVEAQTGRTLSIGGPIRVRWSPLHPVLRFSDVRLSNLPGGSRPDMARVERIEAVLSLPALLAHRIEVVRLTLVGPNILLEQAGGQANWVFRRPATSGGPSGGGFTLGIDAAHVQNGMVTFHFPARTNVIGLRSLDFRDARPGDPLRVDAVLVYSDFKPFTLSARATPTGGTLDPWHASLSAQAFGDTATANGSMSLDGPYTLDLGLRAPALEQLNQLLPQMRLPALHGLALSTRLDSGRARGDLPIPGRTSLRFDSADLGDRVPGLALSGFALDLPSRGGTATARFSARYRAQDFAATASLRMPAVLDGRSRTPASVALRGDGASAEAHGALGLLDAGFDGFDGALSLRAASLDAMRPALPAALSDLALRSDIALPAALDRVALHRLAVTAREGDLDGDLALALSGRRGLSASLHSRRLALDALLPSPGGGSFMTDPLPWTALHDGRLALDWQAEAISWHGQDWPGLRLRASLDDGLLSLELPAGAGPLRGALSAGGAAPEPVRLRLDTDTFPLGPLAGLAGLPGPATGTLRAALDLSAAGTTPQALLGSLHGTIALSTADATLSNRAMRAVAGAAFARLGGAPPPDGRTVVRCLGIAGTAADGVLRLDRIAIDTGSLVASGVGTLDLARRFMTLRLEPLARLAGARVAVPVVVSGPFDAAKPVLDAGAIGKVGLLMDALFGGDHPRTCRAAGLAP